MDNQKSNTEQTATTTQTPKGEAFRLLLQEILKIVSLPEDLIRCVFAVTLSVKLNLFPPLWLMLIGMPSSAKTDIVSLLRGLDFVYFLDSMTMNPFASGYKPPSTGKTYDLLPELDKKCFIVKDYTTIFSLNEETTKKLLGELVSIYDGEFAKFSPTRGLISYRSAFSHLGCLTPVALNRHQQYLNIVGPRFMFYRVPILDDTRRSKGFSIAWNTKDRKSLLQEKSDIVKLFFTDLLRNSLILFKITDQSVRTTLECLSGLMARSRGIVVTQRESFKNEEDKIQSYYEITDLQIEEPWRAFQQLRGLAVCLALLEGRSYVSDADLTVLKTIVISSMPAERADVLDYFLAHSDVKARDLSSVTGKSVRTCQRLLKELEGLGIIQADFQGEGFVKNYNLKDEFRIIKQGQAKTVSPSESLSGSVPIPIKSIADYTNEEIVSTLKSIKDFIQKRTDLTDNLKNQYLEKAKEIEDEGKKRKVLPENQMPLQDQLNIDNILGGSDVPF